MAFNDPISEFLTKIRNAQKAQHKYVDVSISKMKVHLANIMKQHGYIENFIQNETEKKMRIFLKYNKARKGIIRQLKRISKPGRKIYTTNDKIPKIQSGIGLAILSTSQGVIDDATARKLKVGGEVLCYIW
jgi:small subunit ribosomal protein S8